MPAPSRGPKLKKMVFADEYLKDMNGKQAAIRAGYSEATAQSSSSRLLLDVEVRQYIAHRMEERSIKTEITQERVLEEFAASAFLNTKELFAENGTLLNIHDMSDRAARAIASMEVEEIFEGSGENRVWIGYLRKIKLVPKDGTLNSVARHLGMFNDKLNLTVEDRKVDKLQARAEKVRADRVPK